MPLRDDDDEAVGAERVGLERAGIDRAGDDADIGDALGDQPDDLVGEPLLEVDADLRMPGEERAQRLGQEFEQRVGVRQHPDLAGAPARIGGELVAQPLDLGQDRARVLEKRAAGRGRRHALAAAGQERRAEQLLHVPDAGRGGGEREMRPLGAAGDRARLDDLAEEAEIGEVEVHG